MDNDSDGVTCCDYFYAVCMVFLGVAFLAAIPLGILELMGVVYVFYLIWSCSHHATAYICNVTPLDKMFENVYAAIHAAPEIKLYIQCYHMEKRSRQVPIGDDKYRTEYYDERVDTHSANEPFSIRRW